MIRITLSLLVLIFLALMLVPIFAFWLLNEYRRGRRERAAFRYVVHCGICALEFEDRTKSELPQCPRCGSHNERNDFVRI